MYRVLKRDGSSVDFEISKISDAMIKAFDAQGRKYHPSVISLLVLLALLLLRVIKVEKVQDLATFLLGNLAFFFVPVVSGMMNYVDILKGRLIPILVICLVSTAVTFGTTAWAVQFTCRLMAKRKGEKK